MIDFLFEYPKNAAYGRLLSKSKIFDQSRPSRTIRDRFAQEIKQIIWEYKLAPETINLPQSVGVPEIQIFTIVLKDDELKKEILECIDKSIPFPIIFELHFEEKVKVIASYKRASESDSTKWVISDYFESDWIKADVIRRPLPMVRDLGELYSELLTSLMPHPRQPGERLQDYVKRMEEIQVKKRELEKCEVRLRREKQFNRKVEINAELRALKQQFLNMINPLMEPTN